VILKKAHGLVRETDGFLKLTGFREEDYASTRAKLTVEGYRLASLVNRKSYNTGRRKTGSSML
jgi:hypothetical protein